MNMERNKKKSWLVPILLLVIIVLLGIVLYTLVVQPSINGYVIEKQFEAKDIVLENIIAQVQRDGYVQIYMGNQSLTLVPYQGNSVGE